VYDRFVTLQIDVLVDPAGDRPPPGTPIHVELRDTSLADAPARVLSRVDAVVGEPGDDPRLATVLVPESEPSADATVWTHVDVGGDGRVDVGDFITMQSFAVPSAELRPARLAVTVQPVR
jgi:hypothetical protein